MAASLNAFLEKPSIKPYLQALSHDAALTTSYKKALEAFSTGTRGGSLPHQEQSALNTLLLVHGGIPPGFEKKELTKRLGMTARTCRRSMDLATKFYAAAGGEATIPLSQDKENRAARLSVLYPVRVSKTFPLLFSPSNFPFLLFAFAFDAF